ncbi:MAG: DUF3089 domain-containing protein [Lysinibacillus sp.]
MPEMRFIELQKELFSLFGNGDIDDALLLIDRIKTEFPERLDKIVFWEACAFSIQGKKEEAVAALRTGLIEGVWWNPYILTADPDLKGLQAHDGFREIVKKCEEIFSGQKKSAAPELFVYGNHQSEIGLFAMHARGTNVKDFAPYWLNEKGEDLYLYGFPQSSQIFGYHAYCWDDQETAVKEIVQAYKDFKRISHTKSDIIGGASQGGKLSIELSLSKKLPAINGFIAVIPAIKDLAPIEALLKDNEYSSLKGCIITGDQDPFYKNVLELMSLFEKSHIDCKLIVKEGLGHFFPQDFPELLSEAISYILR